MPKIATVLNSVCNHAATANFSTPQTLKLCSNVVNSVKNLLTVSQIIRKTPEEGVDKQGSHPRHSNKKVIARTTKLSGEDEDASRNNSKSFTRSLNPPITTLAERSK